MRVADVADGVVGNVIMLTGEQPADGVTAADPDYPTPGGHILIASLAAGPGWTWDGSAFTAPAPPLPQLSYLQFLALFTNAEQTAIAGAAQSSPAVLIWLTRAAGAQYIDLGDPLTKAGLDALVAGGLLTSDRETAILANQAPS